MGVLWDASAVHSFRTNDDVSGGGMIDDVGLEPVRTDVEELSDPLLDVPLVAAGVNTELHGRELVGASFEAQMNHGRSLFFLRRGRQQIGYAPPVRQPPVYRLREVFLDPMYVSGSRGTGG